MFHWLMRYIVFGPWLRHRVRATIVGGENLPHRGPYILAIGSHKTEVESGILSVYLRRRPLHFYAKAQYWHKGRLLAWFMTAIKQIPMERGDRTKANEAINAGAELLRQGKVVAVYPEATRSPDGQLHGGYPSFVNSAIRAGVDLPIIPVGLVGFEAVSPSGSGLIPQRAEVKIVIGVPIRFTAPELAIIERLHLSKQGDSRARILAESPIAHRVTSQVMRSIAQLCGKPYTTKRLRLPRD